MTIAPRHYPVGLDLSGGECVVVGGGKVGERKVRHLLAHGARVRLVSPEATPFLKRLAGRGEIMWAERKARAGDFKGAQLVMLAGDEPAVMTRLAAAARRHGALVNRADSPADSDFIVAAAFEAGPVTLGVYTGGVAPAFSRWFRRQMAQELGPAIGQMAELTAEARTRLQSEDLRQTQRARILAQMLDSDLYEVLKTKGLKAARGRMETLLKEALRGVVRHSEP